MDTWQIIGRFHFGFFDKLLQSFGWRRDPDALPVDAEEPRFASWSREPDGQMEYVYNPEFPVRALAVRGEDIQLYLQELNSLVRLEPSVLSVEQWELARPIEARADALASIEVIKNLVMPLLEALRDDSSGALARQLAPRAEDYALVFLGEAAAAARKAYERLWSESANLWQPPGPQQSDILCFVAPAGMLAEENELSRHFPGGYRAIAGVLEPSRTWVAWKYVEKGRPSGLAYDGLVWVLDHWSWFPKPYRYLRTGKELTQRTDR